jgi:hypothetical protein
MRGQRVVIILGAGATLADGERKPVSRRPPLDRGFFSSVLRAHGPELRTVSKYMQQHYGESLRDPATDSLERVVAILYTDVFGGELEEEAFKALRTLIAVFIKRLALTTNDIAMSSRCLLYRLIVSPLNAGVSPGDLTVISFNQDIQAEKALDEISTRKIRAGQAVFAFPGCYGLRADPQLTSPTDPDVPTFRVTAEPGEGVSLLKLHGSLNWYSRHNTPNPGRRALFDPKRRIGVTTRRSIDPSLRLTKKLAGRARFTFPIVIPPVVHKSGILHEALRPVWTAAEERLRTADRVIIFGYSCPPNDWESANLVSRALTSNRRVREISVIDPEPAVVLRYVQLGNLSNVGYYSSAARYLAAE